MISVYCMGLNYYINLCTWCVKVIKGIHLYISAIWLVWLNWQWLQALCHCLNGDICRSIKLYAPHTVKTTTLNWAPGHQATFSMPAVDNEKAKGLTMRRQKVWQAGNIWGNTMCRSYIAFDLLQWSIGILWQDLEQDNYWKS